MDKNERLHKDNDGSPLLSLKLDYEQLNIDPSFEILRPIVQSNLTYFSQEMKDVYFSVYINRHRSYRLLLSIGDLNVPDRISFSARSIRLEEKPLIKKVYFADVPVGNSFGYHSDKNKRLFSFYRASIPFPYGRKNSKLIGFMAVYSFSSKYPIRKEDCDRINLFSRYVLSPIIHLSESVFLSAYKIMQEEYPDEIREKALEISKQYIGAEGYCLQIKRPNSSEKFALAGYCPHFHDDYGTLMSFDNNIGKTGSIVVGNLTDIMTNLSAEILSNQLNDDRCNRAVEARGIKDFRFQSMMALGMMSHNNFRCGASLEMKEKGYYSPADYVLFDFFIRLADLQNASVESRSFDKIISTIYDDPLTHIENEFDKVTENNLTGIENILLNKFPFDHLAILNPSGSVIYSSSKSNRANFKVQDLAFKLCNRIWRYTSPECIHVQNTEKNYFNIISLIKGFTDKGFEFEDPEELAIHSSWVAIAPLIFDENHFYIVWLETSDQDTILKERNTLRKLQHALQQLKVSILHNYLISQAKELHGVKLLKLINHTIKNNLGTISSTIEDLLDHHDKYQISPEVMDELNDISRIFKRLNYSLSKLKTLTKDIDIKPKEVSTLLIELFDYVNRKCQINDIEFSYNTTILPPSKVYVDLLLLMEVFDNLWVNSEGLFKKYALKGQIRLDVESDDTYLIIKWSDNGPGIASEELYNIFHFGVQGKHKTGQSGFGLYTASLIMKAHNGSVTVGQSLLGGATFIVKLPYGTRI